MFPVRGEQKGCIPISGLRNGPLGISKQASETATKPIDVQLLWMSLGDGWGCLFVADGTDMTEGSWNKSLIYNTSISAIGTYIRKCWPQPICILFCLLVSLPKLFISLSPLSLHTSGQFLFNNAEWEIICPSPFFRYLLPESSDVASHLVLS